MSQDKLKKKPIDPEIVRADEPHPDEVIHVPKGSNKARFLMTFLLVVLVLTTFTVTGPLMDVLGGKDKDFKTYMSWTTPGGESRSLSKKKFQSDKNAYLLVLGVMNGRTPRDINDEQIASFIVLDDAAEQAGIRTPDSEVAKVIKATFPNSNVYSDTLRRNRTTNKDTETMLRRIMRANRYRELQMQALSVPDPSAVEEAWKGRHQEYSFDYVEQPVAGLVEEARKQAPKGDELKAWFDARPDAEKEAYKTKPETSAEMVGLALEGPWAGTAILAKYPRPADTDAEKEARDYHQGFGYVRFPKAIERGSQVNSQPFEDVKGQAMQEAPVYNALMAWVDDMKKREGEGQKIDLAAEASALGLSYRKQADTLSREAWKNLGVNYVGRVTLDRLFDVDAKAGTLFQAIQVDEKGFVFGRWLEIKPARVPEFSEIEARVSNAWADQKARDLAVAKLDAIRNSFGTPPDPNDKTAPPFLPDADEARFKEVVQAAGLNVQKRDWQERSSPPQPDEPQGDAYIRTAPALYTQKVNSVVKPALNRDGTVAYLVRVGGVRDPSPSKMKPEELDQLAQMQARQEQQMFGMQMASKEFLVARYGLDLASWREDNKRPPE